MLPKEALKEFKKIYKKHYGVDLNDEEASYRANNYFNLHKAVYSEPFFGNIQDLKRTEKLNY